MGEKLKQSKVMVAKAKLSFAKQDLKRLQSIKNSDLDKSASSKELVVSDI